MRAHAEAVTRAGEGAPGAVPMLVRRRVRRETVLSPGQTLQGRYLVGRPIGVGAFALVYRGEEPGRSVAIKEYRLPVNARERQVVQRMWRREVETLSSIPPHPAMAEFIEAFTVERRNYVVQAFAQGETLADILERRGTLAQHEVVRWGRQICEALAYLHGHGVVHHDLKPENVVIGEWGRAILLDLGSAQFLDREAAELLGSEGYLAPEIQQLAKRRGLAAQPGTDVFALGCVLYELLLGQRPSQEHIDGLSVRLMGPLLPRLSRFDEGLVNVLVQAISYDADYRYRSAREMLAELIEMAPAVPQVEPPALEFGTLKGRERRKAGLRVTNAGGGTLSAEASTSAPWLRLGTGGLQEEKAVAWEGNDQTLTVTALAEALPAGEGAAAQIKITSPLSALGVRCTARADAQNAMIQTYYPAVFLRARQGQRVGGVIKLRNVGDEAGEFVLRRQEGDPLEFDPGRVVLGRMDTCEIGVTVETRHLAVGAHTFPVVITAQGGHRADVEIHVDVFAGPVRRLLET